MKNKIISLLIIVAIIAGLTVVVYANDYETDKIPLTSSTTTTSTTEYRADKTTTAHSERHSTTNKRPGGVCDIEHTEGDTVEENKVAPTCTKAGSYDLVIYCMVCEEEISRETKTISPLGHTYSLSSFVEGVASLNCQRDNCTDTKLVDFSDCYNTDSINPNEILDANNDGFINAKDFAILNKK